MNQKAAILALLLVAILVISPLALEVNSNNIVDGISCVWKGLVWYYQQPISYWIGYLIIGLMIVGAVFVLIISRGKEEA